MINADDIKRMQTAVGSQQSGNDFVGNFMFKGGFACNSSGNVIAGSSSGPFVFVKDSGGAAGTFRAYPQVNGQIVSIDYINQGGFTPRAPSTAETTIVQVTGYGIDAANNQHYITLQQADFTGALQGSLPSKYVIGVEVAVTLSSNSNPL